MRENKPSSCLVLVEGDDILLDGRRRVRLTRETMSDLQEMKRVLTVALDLPSLSPSNNNYIDVMVSKMKIQIFNPTTDRFHELTTVEAIPATNCRLRLTLADTTALSSSSSPRDPSSEASGGTLLALPWREFSVNLSDGSFKINNRPLRIQEVSNSGLGTGLNVWDGSIALARYLEAHAEAYVVRKDILELGAGTGVVGIAAGMLGAKRVVLTDLEYSIENLQSNILANQSAEEAKRTNDISSNSLLAEARVLDWFDLRTCDDIISTKAGCSIISNAAAAAAKWIPDLILASDVVWIDTLVLPLVQTLHRICTRAIEDNQRPPLILMSYQCRSQAVERLLLHSLSEHSFEIDAVPPYDVKSTRIQIFRIRFKEVA